MTAGHAGQQRTYGPRPHVPARDSRTRWSALLNRQGREIDLAVRQLIEVGDACATQILEKRRVDLEAGVALLIAQESVTAEQFAPLRSSGAAGSVQAAA